MVPKPERGARGVATRTSPERVLQTTEAAVAIETESERRARERANLVAALERSGGKVYGSGGAEPAPGRGRGDGPAPMDSPCFDTFIDDFQQFGGPEGITAAEWAAWVGQPVDLFRERLDVLFDGATLTYDNNTERYAVHRVESPIDSPPAQGEAANPTPASNSSPGAKSQGEHGKSLDVQPSNESGGVRVEETVPSVPDGRPCGRGVAPSSPRDSAAETRATYAIQVPPNCHLPARAS